jgi:hypothetical protein
MAPHFTPEQRAVLIAQHGRVVYFVDVVTQEEYAVLPAEQFRQVAPLLDPQEEFKASEFYPLIAESWTPILNDPALDIYDQDYLAPPQQ